MRLIFTLIFIVLFTQTPSAIAKQKARETKGSKEGKSPNVVSSQSAFQNDGPAITSIRNRVVTVTVPAGYDKVWIEVLTRATTGKRKKAVAPSWKVQEEQFVRGRASELSFTLPKLTPRDHLRVFGTRLEVLPDFLTTGITEFGAPPIEEQIPDSIRTPENEIQLSDTTGVTASATLLGANSLGDSGVLTESREVAEADVWRLDGDRLYYFNDLRGLQVFDLTDDSNPGLMGTLRMPGAGQDMYLLDQDHVVLIKRVNTWNWWFDYPITIFAGSSGVMTMDIIPAVATTQVTSLSLAGSLTPLNSSQPARHEVVVVNVHTGQPRSKGSVEFEGNIRESRLVGRVLYIATDSTQKSSTNRTIRGTKVLSFDLHNPANPVRRDELFVEGTVNANAITATNRYLFVTNYSPINWSNSQITTVDISEPTGVMKKVNTFEIPGSVPDKFKMNLDGDNFTVVSTYSKERLEPPPEALEAQRNGDRIWWNRWVPVSRVSTFSFANPTAPVALGTLELAEGEELHATRYDGKRLYVITALHRPTWGIFAAPLPGVIDPLWVVDLSNPVEPKALGELIIPGFSTYIHPLGDRLVAIGLVDNQPTVSLFNVANPKKPQELSRIRLGSVSGWSWSEAVWNEKAFSVLPEQGLILVPLSSYDNEGFSAQVQLIDLKKDSLVKRGVIAGDFAPSRATAHNDSLVAISPTKLVTVDARNRQKPVIKADLEIAWDVDRVFHVGEYLIQITGNLWSQKAGITVSPAENPDETLAFTGLEPLGIAGVTIKNGILHLIQGTHYYGPHNSIYDSATNSYRLLYPKQVFTSFDLTQLPVLKKLGSLTIPSAPSFQADAIALWPSETTLVWAAHGWQQEWTRHYWDRNYWRENYIASRPLELCALNVSNPAQIQFLSQTRLGNDQPWVCGKPFAADGKVLVSFRHEGQHLSKGYQHLWNDPRYSDPLAFTDATNDPMRNRHFLLDVDYRKPAAPVVGQGISVPGNLVGQSRNGSVLYTTGPGYGEDGKANAAKPMLHASGYDGTKVHLVDQVPVPAHSPAITQHGETIFVFKGEQIGSWRSGSKAVEYQDVSGITLMPAYTTHVIGGRYGWTYVENPEKSTLQTFTLQESGKLIRLSEFKYENEQSLSLVNDLALLGNNSNQVRFLNIQDPVDIKDLGVFQAPGWSRPKLEYADGDSTTGAWIPEGPYGVDYLPAKSELSE